MKKKNNLLKKVHHEGIKQKRFSQDLTHVPDSHYTSSQEVQHEQNKPPQKGSLWTKLAPQKMFTMKKRPPHIIPPQKKVTIKKVDVYQEKYVHGDCRCKRRFWGRFSFCWKHIAKCYNISEVAEIACGARWCAITCNVWPWYDMRPWENKQTTMIWDHEKNKPTWYEIMMWEKFLAWKSKNWRYGDKNI